MEREREARVDRDAATATVIPSATATATVAHLSSLIGLLQRRGPLSLFSLSDKRVIEKNGVDGPLCWDCARYSFFPCNLTAAV